MKIIVHDLGAEFSEALIEAADRVICADGKYAPCQGCFKCWVKHPAVCTLKDSLRQMCRILGQADELVLITENCYGGYSPKIKNLLDRSIGMSTPFAVMRGGQMHHTLRYGTRHLLKVVVYGEVRPQEKKTLALMAERNAVNLGFEQQEVLFVQSIREVKEAAL